VKETLYTINIIHILTVNIVQHQCKKELMSIGSSHNLACWQFRFKVAASQFVVFYIHSQPHVTYRCMKYCFENVGHTYCKCHIILQFCLKIKQCTSCPLNLMQFHTANMKYMLTIMYRVFLNSKQWLPWEIQQATLCSTQPLRSKWQLRYSRNTITFMEHTF
jgi:hypothetical protein